MDGTVLTDWDRGPRVPDSNLAAIHRLIEKGGAFSIASGRQFDDVMRYFSGKELNAPAVLGNGTVLHACPSGDVLFKLPLGREFKTEAVELARENGYVWLLVGNLSSVYQVAMGDKRDGIWAALSRKLISIDEFISGDYLKLVFVLTDPKLMPQLQAAVDGMKTAAQMKRCLSAPVFLETFDAGAGKGNGIRRALELSGLADRKLVCIGDYYNDLEMLEAADIAACPSNAPADIQAACQIVTCGNNSGAVAGLLRALEAM